MFWSLCFNKNVLYLHLFYIKKKTKNNIVRFLLTLNSRCECLMRKATPLFSFSMFPCRSLAVTSKMKQTKYHQMKNYYNQSCKAGKKATSVLLTFFGQMMCGANIVARLMADILFMC